ncbi:MAG: hypothetical protein ACI31G_04490 [Bacilli bacterium]
MSKNKSSKKGLKIFLAIFIPLFIIVILPITLVFALFYDGSFNKTEYPNNTTVETKMNNALFNSVNSTKDDGLIKIGGSEYGFNELLHSTIESSGLLDESGDVISNYYIDIAKEDITLTIDLKLSFFKTKAKITLTPTLQKNSDDYLSDCFILKIKDLKVGRLGGLYCIAKSFILENVTDEDLEQSFKDSHLTIHSDLQNGELKYYVKDLITDAKSLLSEQDFSGIFSSILSFSFENRLLDLSIKENEFISLNLDINNLDDNSTYKTVDKETNVDFEPYINKLETVVNSNIINNENKEMMFSYLIYGFDYLTDEEKLIVNGVDLSSIGITVNSLYQGITYEDSVDLKTVINNKITYSNPNESILKIDEDEFNGYLKLQDLIGYNFLLEKEISENNFNYNYFAIDDFYINFLNDKLYLDIGFSVNGFDTSIFMDFMSINNNSNKILLSLSNVYFGNLTANEETIDLLFDILVSNFSDTTGFLTVDKVNKTITIDLFSLFSQEIKDTIAMLGGDLEFSIVGDTLNDNGYINLKLN